MLKGAIATVGPRPSFLVHLALAHHGLRQPEMADQCLLQARDLPKTPREQAELYDAARLIQGRR
jgi:hypothetical protein